MAGVPAWSRAWITALTVAMPLRPPLGRKHRLAKIPVFQYITRKQDMTFMNSKHTFSKSIEIRHRAFCGAFWNRSMQ